MDTKKQFLRLERVGYGKKDTPLELREYHLKGVNFPVGTVDEWKNFAGNKGFDGVEVLETSFVISVDQINKFAEVQ